MKHKKILILGAFPPELNPLRQGFPESSRFHFAETGVGMVSAAASTTRELMKMEGVEAALFTGSLGAFSESVELLTPVLASGVVLSDAALSLGKGYLPEIQRRRFSASPAEVLNIGAAGSLNSVVEGWVASSLAITSNAPLGKQIQEETGATFENLELFGVALACHQAGIPWAAVGVVTNHVGENASAQWKANHKRAGEITALVVSKLM